jgi:carboxypeptidase C (cathepsin A)
VLAATTALNRHNMSGRPFYIAGESYAGRFIPAFATAIRATEPTAINLQGIMIGNGEVDAAAAFRS